MKGLLGLAKRDILCIANLERVGVDWYIRGFCIKMMIACLMI